MNTKEKVVNKILGGREFANKEGRDKFLNMCMELWALAEDFLRCDFDDECIILKDTFEGMIGDLKKEDWEELKDLMTDRGL